MVTLLSMSDFVNNALQEADRLSDMEAEDQLREFTNSHALRSGGARRALVGRFAAEFARSVPETHDNANALFTILGAAVDEEEAEQEARLSRSRKRARDNREEQFDETLHAQHDEHFGQSALDAFRRDAWGAYCN